MMSRSFLPIRIAVYAVLVGASIFIFAQSELQIGYAILDGDNTSPTGTALFTFRNGEGTLVSQTGVAAVPAISAGRLFVDQQGTRTAVAVVNTSDTLASLDLTLRDAMGSRIASVDQDFAPGQHLALFIDELFDLPPDFTAGSLTFSTRSGPGEWAAVTLRQSTNVQGEPLFATLPVVPLGDSGPVSTQIGQLLFPQIGAGGGLLSTQIVLINSAPEKVSGKLRFTASDGTPLPLELDSVSASEFDYQIPADGVLRVQLTRPPGEPIGVGYATVSLESGPRLPSGTAIFQFQRNGFVISEAGVAAAPLTRRARLFVDNAATQTGVALAIPESPAGNLTFRLLDRQNREIDSQERTLPSEGHLSIFADELFSNLPAGFTGVMEIEGPMEFAPVTLKLTTNRRNDPILTTLPVVAVDGASPDGPLFFPQIGFGLGFSTRLILLSQHLGSASTGNLLFRTTEGAPLSIPLGEDEVSESAYELPAGGSQQLYPGVTAGLARILVDPDQLVLNQGSTRPLRPITLDEEGNPRDDFPLQFQSLNPETVSVDATGNLTALNRGFSTLVISSEGLLESFTVTSGTVTGNQPGFRPTDVAQDFGGQVYLANSEEHTILLAPDLETAPERYAGQVGQPGLQDTVRLASRFDGPAFLAVHQGLEGELFVSDAANHAIRKISPGNAGAVETIAGNGAAGSRDGSGEGARFRSPQGIALDDRGFLWIADSGNHIIRRLNLSSGQVSTVAGRAGRAGYRDAVGNQARFQEPKGLVFEAESLTQQLLREAGGQPPPPASVLVADSGNDVIRRVYEDGRVETVGGDNVISALRTHIPGDIFLQTSAAVRNFQDPVGVAVDPFGNIYVSQESGDVRVLLINGDTLLAAEKDSFNQPGGMAITVKGRILVAESNRTVQQIRYAGPSIDSLTPGRVSARGGTRVVLKGANIAPESIVVVGGQLIREIDFEDTTEISFLLPELPSGLQTLSLLHRGGLAQTQIEIVPPLFSELSAGQITTLAGGTTFVGDGAESTAAQLGGPTSVAVAASGDFFVTDREQHRIRRIKGITRIISSVAGGNGSGDNGDGRLGILTTLNRPSDLVIDSEGNLLFVDSANHRVRKLNLESGVVTTIAGTGSAGFSGDGAAPDSAQLNAPEGIAVGPEGMIWISDSGNHRIRRIDPTNDLIETVAGTGEPGFSDTGNALSSMLHRPRGIAVTRNGEAYFADQRNHRIRFVTSSGGMFTVVGSGVPGFGGDGGRPIDAQVDGPTDVLQDPEGRLVIADSGNHRVRRVDFELNQIETVAGTGLAAFDGDGGAAVAGSLSSPSGVALDAARNLYIADTGNARIRRVDHQTGQIETVAGSSLDFSGTGGPASLSALGAPGGLVFSEDALWVAEESNHRFRSIGTGQDNVPASFHEDGQALIFAFAGSGDPGYEGDDGPALEARFRGPSSLSRDGDGWLLVDRQNHAIRRVDAAGHITTLIGTGEPGLNEDVPGNLANLNLPSATIPDGQGGVLFTDSGNHRIGRMGISGFVFTLAGTGEPGFDGDGDRPSSAKLKQPTDLVLTGEGQIIFSDTGNHRIRIIDLEESRIATLAGGEEGFSGDGGPAAEARFSSPAGLYLNESEVLYVADAGNHRIRAIDLRTGVISTVAGDGGAGFDGDGKGSLTASLLYPFDILEFAGDSLVISDQGNGRIRIVRLQP